MAVYEVSASDASGRNVKVKIDADSVKTARTKARAQGLTPISVVLAEGSLVGSAGGGGTAMAAPSATSSPFGKIKSEELANMTRQLATLVKAHVPIVESLNALVDQIEHPKLKGILMSVRQMVKEGRSLGDGFAMHPATFSRVYVNMVKAGESSGRLDVVLLRLADLSENQEKLKNKVMGSLLYPIIMVVVGFAVLVVIFVKVVPQITKIFVDMKKTLPMPTIILIAISDFIQNWGLYVGAVAFICAVFIERYIKTPHGRAVKDARLLKLPVVSVLMRRICVARFARTLGTLLSSGVPMLAALEITRNVVDNAVFEDTIEKASTQVSEGRSLAVTMKASGEFPPIVVHMVGVGEKSGELEAMLLSVAENYEQQIETALGALTGILEPVMMIVMAVLVGFIVMGVLLPIFDMNEFG
ncbi:MAG: type II secretion system inner membrane protein GspF [Bdellovibrionales bacterium]|nr:type II secretion system inner membrane protein GspF [Bdellovibrionales bacterium]